MPAPNTCRAVVVIIFAKHTRPMIGQLVAEVPVGHDEDAVFTALVRHAERRVHEATRRYGAVHAAVFVPVGVSAALEWDGGRFGAIAPEEVPFG